ncbi:CubicO group peptidase, beta-lactamase class C family [Clostridium cavendishii DSM 21758]|uniref:CubicO group peptidase, beta-lactamase class C family n=1 Tax=Clostridium cavendishii DSM 21758 TaxID=1121302 RepID=A0A1M6GNE7_9CLOT|nr:serine hydrolase domain-containing protein [Clostridium cavendishii]SHJ11495.1 CubicO group peptidase, beta-lactamase class C family [Clostridium cavendishii DSM 21758]
MKRRIVAVTLTILMSMSSMQAFAVNQKPLGTGQAKPSNILNFPLKTVDGQDIIIPDANKIKQSNVNVQGEEKNKKSNKKSINEFKNGLESNYNQTKAVAEQKASLLTNGYGCTSVQYALIDNGKIVLSGNSGVYSREDNKPVTADNMYSIASISKMFVTTAIMRLVDEGQVFLDTPVTEYVDDFKMADDRYKKITVRMLLNHSSGLMGSSFSNTLLFGDNSSYAHDTFIKQLRTQRLKADPGAHSVYCNDGFTLAEILVERVTGISYTDYVAENITNTLKMNNTKTPINEFDRNKLAKAYHNGISNALPAENFNALGAAGLYSTAEDLCNFAKTFTKDSNGIVSKKSIKAMENKEYLRGIWTEDSDNTLAYGLGWDSVNLYPFNQYNIKAVAKGGDSVFYHSNLVVLPEKNMAMAVVSSGGSSFYDEVMASQVLLTALKEKGEIKDILPDKTFTAPEKVAVPSELKNYEGLYALSTGFINAKIDESEGLIISNPQEPQSGTKTLAYTKDGTFRTSDGSQGIKFVKQSNGKTYMQQIAYLTLPYLGQAAMNSYVGQKEELNKLKDNIAKDWQKREGKRYYLVNEKYSSVMYILESPVLQNTFAKGFEGYLGMDKIVDKDLALSLLDGPGSLSRDQHDYKFYNKDNFEYISSNNQIYVEEAAIKTLPKDNKFTCQINKDGYAEWYKISDESAGKEITVDIPKNAAFVAYDSNGALINDSLVTGSNKVTLPKDGKIVFLGSKKAKFTVQYKAS